MRTCLLALLLLPASLLAAEPEPIRLFDSGNDGYKRYRIPSLLTAADGTLLAVCEGRVEATGLRGNIDLVIKRSSDSGKTWSKLAVIADDGPHTLGNPCMVLDRDTGVIWMGYTRSHGPDTEEQIVAGTSKETTRVFITKSADHGKTWSPGIDISATARRPTWTWYGTGPGTGIQLKDGRLVLPSYHAEAKDRIYSSHMVYSDDHGKTWKLGDTVGRQISECFVVQKRDGSLVLNSRTIEGEPKRTIAVSKDAGQTWGPTSFDANLFDSNCEGCLVKIADRADGKPRWLFSAPALAKRRDLTLRVSYNEGQTWSYAKRLQEGDSQYSSLAILPDKSIGCLYERWTEGNYHMFFSKVTLDWLTDGVDTLSR